MKTRLIFLSCLLTATVAAHAQDFPSPNLTLYAGYNYTHTDSGLAMNGFDVSASVRGTNSVYLKGDFKSGFATTSGVSTHLLTGTVGPVYSFRAGKQVRPFAEVLVGDAEFSAAGNGENAFALQIGGGLDVNRVRWGLRVIDVDYLYTHFGGAGQNHVQISTGLLFHF